MWAAFLIRGCAVGKVKNYLAFSTLSTRRWCLSFDRWRHSCIRTLSPTPAVSFSSWTFTRGLLRMILPYRACCLRFSNSTTMVLFILSETTMPVRFLRLPLFFWVSFTIASLMFMPQLPERRTDQARAHEEPCRYERCRA